MAANHLVSSVRYGMTAIALVGSLTVQGELAHAAQLGAGDRSETYRGYRIEMAQDVPNAEIGQLRKAAERQVDIVEATSLDSGTKAFLRRFPVVVRSGSGEGSHYSGGASVTIAVEDPRDDRPILLHEYMHVFHFRKLPGGRNNPDILTSYGRAKEGGFYPPGAYLLKNQGEFFAMTASVFLHGTLAREPFTREELRRKQPVYYGYLNRLFGTPRAAAAVPSRLAGAERSPTAPSVQP